MVARDPGRRSGPRSPGGIFGSFGSLHGRAGNAILQKNAAVKYKDWVKLLNIEYLRYSFDLKEDLIKKADAAMYAAKQAGRNNSVKYADHIPLIRCEDRE